MGNTTMRKIGGSLILLISGVSGYGFVQKNAFGAGKRLCSQRTQAMKSSSLKMVDQAVLQGAAVALAGLGAGIGLVAFTEDQGERARQRGGGLSEDMNTKLAGKLMEDYEVSSVADVGSLADQLEAALRETGGDKAEVIELTEEEKQRMVEEADDGW